VGGRTIGGFIRGRHVSGPIVVDVGNSRIKWGLCSSEQVWSIAALSPDDPAAWQQQWDQWKLGKSQSWIVAGVHPQRVAALVDCLQGAGARVAVLVANTQLPLQVEAEVPAKVGIDRLLNAVAANRRRHENVAAIIADAGSAVTVDYIDPKGIFRGGAIYP